MDRFTSNLAVFLIYCNFLVYGDLNNLKIETVERPEKCEGLTKNNDYLKVHYTGILLSDGKQFDSSIERGEPFEFQLGNNEVIKGWEQGLMNMCVGEKRKLTVPPHLAYGETGAGETIPGGSTLEFDIELLSIEEAPKPNNVFKDIDTDEDGLLSQDEVGVFLKLKMGGAAGAAMGGNDDMMENMVKEFIRIQDKNKDGKINPREFAQPTHGSPKDEL